MTVSLVSMRFASSIAASILLLPSIARAEVPRLVKDIYPGMYGSMTNEAVVFDGKLFFPAAAPTTTPFTGYINLWTSDRTEAGTTLFTELDPGTSSSPRNLVVVGSTLFFFTLDGSLCTSDGTAAGTKKVLKLSSTPGGLVAHGGRAFFASGGAIYVSDGTSAGTVALTDATTTATPSLVSAGDWVFFVAYDPAHGTELWKTKGSTSDTSIVSDLAPGTAGSQPGSLVAFGSELFYLTSGGPTAMGGALYKTDGTTITLVKSIRPDAPILTDFAHDLSISAGRLYFRALTVANGEEPWVSDGTTAGTFMLADIFAGTSGSGPLFGKGFVAAGSLTIFGAKDAAHGDTLWKTDGTTAGTSVLGPNSLFARNLFSAGARVYFGALTGADSELWQTDGTAAGTKKITNIAPSASADVKPLAMYAGALMFTANDGAHGAELWTLDPDPVDSGVDAAPDTASDSAADSSVEAALDTSVEDSAPVTDDAPDTTPDDTIVATDTNVEDSSATDAAEDSGGSPVEAATEDDSGCGCRTTSRSPTNGAWLALALALVGRRRRRT